MKDWITKCFWVYSEKLKKPKKILHWPPHVTFWLRSKVNILIKQTDFSITLLWMNYFPELDAVNAGIIVFSGKGRIIHASSLCWGVDGHLTRVWTENQSMMLSLAWPWDMQYKHCRYFCLIWHFKSCLWLHLKPSVWCCMNAVLWHVWRLTSRRRRGMLSLLETHMLSCGSQ